VPLAAEHKLMTPFELTFAKLMEHTSTSVAVLAVNSFYCGLVYFVWNSLCNICWVFDFMVSFDWNAYLFNLLVSFIFIPFNGLILPKFTCLFHCSILAFFTIYRSFLGQWV
jgi:hypothetical protein